MDSRGQCCPYCSGINTVIIYYFKEASNIYYMLGEEM